MGKATQERRKLKTTLPTRFAPRFFDEADGRVGVVKEIRRRYKQLREDTGVDSYQRDILCRRAIFLAVQCESMESGAAEGEPFDFGVYTQAVNALSGLLTKLGLKSQKVTTLTLADKLRERQA